MFGETIDIKLEQFEGPLDLLLYLIKKNEINIYDIPIARITQEYLLIIEQMQKIKFDVAAEYILMAATLIKIKADFMIPKQSFDEDIEDPRQPLVERLLEYQKIKQATEVFRNIELEARKLFGRNIQLEFDRKEDDGASIMDLMDVFTPMLKKGLSLSHYRIPRLKKTINEKIAEILNLLENSKNINFNEYVLSLESMYEIILTFVSILEMVNKNLVRIEQNRQYGEIWLKGC